MVEISRPSAVGFSSASKAESGGISSGALTRRRAGSEPAERGAALAQVFHLLAVFGQPQERNLGDVLVGNRNVEAVAERLQRLGSPIFLA